MKQDLLCAPHRESGHQDSGAAPDGFLNDVMELGQRFLGRLVIPVIFICSG